MTKTIANSVLGLYTETEIYDLKVKGYTILQIEKGFKNKYIVEYVEQMTVATKDENLYSRVSQCCCDSEKNYKYLVPNNCCDR